MAQADQVKRGSLSGGDEFQNDDVETSLRADHLIVRLRERGDGAGNKIKMVRPLCFFHHHTQR